MTLEDFFTLSEMKDGLTAPARVEELIAVMQKEKDCAVKNIGDATRQWSAVSSTIAATDNRDCLDLFIQLDGLFFINGWLKDAQKFDIDTSESFAEEAITAMLGALEKLHVDNDRSRSSGIWTVVNNLIDHSSSRIQDRARELCDHWNQGTATNDTTHQHVEGGEASHDNAITLTANHSVEGGQPECLAIVALPPLSEECAEEENRSVEPMRNKVLPSENSGGLQAENAEDAQSHMLSNHLNSCTTIGDTDPLPKVSIQEEPPVSTIEGTASIESCSSAPEQCSVGQVSAPNLAESTEDAKDSSDKSGVGELSAGSTILESIVVDSGIDMANVQESAEKHAQQNNVCINEVEEPTLKSETKSGVDDMGPPNYHNTWSSKTAGQIAESCTVLQESSAKEHIVDAETSLSKTENGKSPLRDQDTHPCSESEALDGILKMKMEDSQSAYKEKEHVGDADVNLISTPKFDKLVKGVKNSNSNKSVRRSRRSDINKRGKKGARNTDFIAKRSVDFIKPMKDARTHDSEYEYDIMDALEVARQVAQEVEREVEDYRGPSCSSSSDKSSDGTPDSTDEKEDEPISGSQEEMLDRQSVSSDEYMQGGEEERSSQSESKDTEAESCLPDMESSQVTEAAAQEPEANSERGDMCGFDLNQEVCSDDMDRDHQVNATTSTLVSVVSASRPAVSPGLPVAPLQFEGALGWKGSALTSAFRPASPRKISGNGSRRDHLDFDLNVAEGEDDKFGDLTSGKQRHTSFGLHSGESITSKKPERFQLDLNCMGDGDDDNDLRKEEHLFHRLNGHHSPSPASSSSMQPSTRNFDLNDRPFNQNDRPFNQNDHLERGSYLATPWQAANAYGSTKPDEPAISILGTRVEVKRKDFVPQTISFLNAKSPEFPSDANVSRTPSYLGMGPTPSYGYPPSFGYNGPAMPFPASMYGAGPGGSIPYMVDSRGAPVVPQLVGSATAAPPYGHQHPFFMNMTGASLALNGVGPSRPTFDHNSGFVIDGGNGNRDPSSLRQFFVPGQGRPMEELSRNTKRKEPDGGWEPYPFSYKHQQPPWK